MNSPVLRLRCLEARDRRLEGGGHPVELHGEAAELVAAPDRDPRREVAPGDAAGGAAGVGDGPQEPRAMKPRRSGSAMRSPPPHPPAGLPAAGRGPLPACPPGARRTAPGSRPAARQRRARARPRASATRSPAGHRDDRTQAGSRLLERPREPGGSNGAPSPKSASTRRMPRSAKASGSPLAAKARASVGAGPRPGAAPDRSKSACGAHLRGGWPAASLTKTGRTPTRSRPSARRARPA